MAPAVTHMFVSGQQTWPAPHPDSLPKMGLAQKMPGATGVRHARASGQQYEPWSAHGDTQAAPGVTQISVIGQHTSPAAQAFLSALQEVAVGVRQCFASGQQYL